MRPDLHNTMLSIATILKMRGTCAKLKVGAVITDARGLIIGSGYNGVPASCVHCIDVPCPGVGMPKGSDLCEAVHAEQNALLNCRVLPEATTIYVTHAPCLRCVKTLLNTPIQTIYFLNGEDLESAALALWVRSLRNWVQYESEAAIKPPQIDNL